MNAVLERPALAPTARRLAPSLHGEEMHADARGVHFITNHSIYYPPQIGVTDVLEVNFDQRHVEHDGTYLVAYPGTDDPHGCPWGGARRFQRIPGSGLHIFEGDEWVPVRNAHRDMVVLGQVLHVYRRTK